ncbi:hypothetical protein [Coralloluteibacterium thermophilus]|uniref:Exo-alpha-sialidase n=1 Tax=Coralloluteibacterium thermophilum TaxID=2707049 RepID=A0ABV9NKF1_9GAMM
MWQPVPIVGGAYSDETRPWSAQDCVNYLPVPAERPQGRSPSKLLTPPGLRLFAAVGTGPCRGARNVEGALFVVSGNTLYRVHANGSSTSLGTIPGVGPVGMSHNQITGGNELLITAGSSGYVFNTRTSTLSRITDPGYPGAVAVDYVDSYLVQVEPFGRFWFHSELADATDYNTVDRYESEASPDRIVTLRVNQSEVVVFSERTIEFFDNVGAATNTFQSKRIVIQTGIAGRDAVAAIDNSLMWLGDDGIVYRLNGYQAVRMSTHPVEQEISRCNIALAQATVWEDRGHKVWYLTFPDGLTWGYDVASGEWHRRQSYGLRRWRAVGLVRWQDRWLAGDYANGNLYEVTWDEATENGAPLVSERISGVLHGEQNRLLVAGVEFVFDTGVQSHSDPDAFVDVRYSKDGGRNWSNWRRRSLGEIGEYAKRVKLLRLGQGRQWVFHVRVSSSMKRDLLAASILLEPCDR